MVASHGFMDVAVSPRCCCSGALRTLRRVRAWRGVQPGRFLKVMAGPVAIPAIQMAVRIDLRTITRRAADVFPRARQRFR